MVLCAVGQSLVCSVKDGGELKLDIGVQGLRIGQQPKQKSEHLFNRMCMACRLLYTRRVKWDDTREVRRSGQSVVDLVYFTMQEIMPCHVDLLSKLSCTFLCVRFAPSG